MDAAFEPIADAVMRPVLGPLLTDLAALLPKDRPPYAEGVQRLGLRLGLVRLRRQGPAPPPGPARPRAVRPALLRARARSSAAARRCGRRWPARRRELAAAQGADPAAWRVGRRRWSASSSRPGLLPDTMRWTNRPTFQQVLELDAPGGGARPRRGRAQSSGGTRAGAGGRRGAQLARRGCAAARRRRRTGRNGVGDGARRRPADSAAHGTSSTSASSTSPRGARAESSAARRSTRRRSASDGAADDDRRGQCVTERWRSGGDIVRSFRRPGRAPYGPCTTEINVIQTRLV